MKEPCFIANRNISSNCTTTVDPGPAERRRRHRHRREHRQRGGIPGLENPSGHGRSVNYDGAGSREYQAERVITDPLATSSGLVFFTTFRPYGDDCAIGGRTFLWAVRYNTGGAPAYALQGKALMQVSTASVEQLDLGTRVFRGRHRFTAEGEEATRMEGVPPTAQGLSLLSPPPPVKRILHMKER